MTYIGRGGNLMRPRGLPGAQNAGVQNAGAQNAGVQNAGAQNARTRIPSRTLRERRNARMSESSQIRGI
jgi:hypothetical protein